MDNPHDLAEAFNRLDALLAAAEAAGPAMELLLATGKAQGITETTMFRRLQINGTIVRWSQRLSPDAADQREAAIAKRLDRLSRQAERMERDQNIQIETLALFIRYYLTVSTPVPEAHQEAARAQGKARFEQFVEQLGRHLLRGRSLVRDVVEELHPDPMRMEDAAAAAQAQERVS